MKDLDLLSVGSWTLFDYILRADHYPEEGETVALNMPSKLIHTKFFGDCSVNLAAAAAAMNVNVGLAMVVGDDFNTSGYRSHLLEMGIDLEGVDVRPGVDSGYSYNISDNKGRSVCFSHLGIAEDQSEWTPPLEQIARARAVVVSEKFCNYTLQTIQHARKAGKITAINGMVGTANELAPEFLKAADYLFISQRELEALMRLLEITSPRDLLAMGPKMVVATRGTRGSRWLLEDQEFDCDSVPAMQVQDTTGAGDAFAGTALAMLLQGVPPLEAARHAAAASSFVVEKWGCQTNLQSYERVQRRMQMFFEGEAAQ